MIPAMSKEKIRKEIQKLQQTFEKSPRILKFRGRKVVPISDWKYGDWSQIPDMFHEAVIMSDVPEDWRRDYFALLEKLKQTWEARLLCYDCAIDQAQRLKQEIDRRSQCWEQNGGEEAKQKFYEECGEPKTSEFRRQDAKLHNEWQFYNELAGANNRTCEILNFFKCPYGEEWKSLIENGTVAHNLWEHIEWYEHHWYRSTITSPTPSMLKWFHFDEPRIIDIENFEDIVKALEDGRLERIIEEHERYMKETGTKTWSL